MLKQELKLFYTEKFKIIGFVLISICLLLSVYSLVQYKEEHQGLIDKMSLGLVSYDVEEEIDYLLSIFHNTAFSERFEVNRVSEEQAQQMLENEEISAYIIIPEGFVHSIDVGTNYPLTIVGDENDWLEVGLIKLAMNVGISYLTTAQAGIYSAIDTARDLGSTQDEINSILVPINLKYGASTVSFNKYFDKQTVSAVDSGDLSEYYLFSSILFLMIISTGMFITTIQEGIEKPMLNRYRLTGLKLNKVLIFKFLALNITIFTYSFPILYFFKWNGFFIILLVSSICFLIANITSKSIGVISIMFVAFFTTFISGGIIPLIFLPRIFNILAKFTPNYWVININANDISLYMIIGFILLFNTTSYYIMDRRLKN